MYIENKIDLIKFEKEDAEFIKENFPSYFKDNSIENIEKIIESWQSTLSFCITFNDKKVGIITLGEKQDKKLSLGMMIKDEFQGKGIAQFAFELIKSKARELGYSTIISSCSIDNIASIRLHQKCGFKLIKAEINTSGKEMYRWGMEI